MGEHIQCTCGHDELAHGFTEDLEWTCDLCECDEFTLDE